MPHIKNRELQELIDIFKDLTGIQYSKKKIYLFENRLAKFVDGSRGIGSYEMLINALKDKTDSDLIDDYVNELTTNFTYFFREPKHFRFIQHMFSTKFQNEKDIRIWSAAASGGHEAYSMAISLEAILHDSNKKYQIMGTDIAVDKIEKAKRGIYSAEEIEEYLNPASIKRYFNQIGENYSVIESIKKNVHFAPLNILGAYPFKHDFHLIFLRNILIYFENAEKEKILKNIANYIKPGGYLVISMSESLTDLNVPFRHVAHSIYVHTKERHVSL